MKLKYGVLLLNFAFNFNLRHYIEGEEPGAEGDEHEDDEDVSSSDEEDSEVVDEEVIGAAVAANAHAFILSMPNGYFTEVWHW